jgi:transposase-like protein
MWKLRTHLLTHTAPRRLSKRGDHEYAGPAKLSTAGTSSTPLSTPKKTVSDHPYANPTDSTPAPQLEIQDANVGADRVNSEHSYGTRQKSAAENCNSEKSADDHAYYSISRPAPVDVQVVSVQVRRDPQPAPVVMTKTPIPELPAVKPQGSAKRKASLKAMNNVKKKKIVEASTNETMAGQDKNKKYTCDLCGKNFPQPYRKNRHVLEVHHKEKRHSCLYCDKSFFKVSSKSRHELTHIIHDTWKCPACQKIFKDRSSMKYHIEQKVCAHRGKK